MSSLLFVSGQISALEDKLLTAGQLDRMIGADTPDEAFGVMSELQYAQYFDDDLQARDFANVIERGLLETKELLVSGSDQDPALDIIWGRFDINNLKRALKERFLESRTEIGEFTEDNGYSPLGKLDKASVEALVWSGRGEESVLTTVVSELVEGEEFDIRSAEIALDQAYFASIRANARGTVKEYVGMLIDEYNARSVARSVLILGEPLDASLWAEGGTMEYSHFADIDTQEALVSALEVSVFGPALGTLADTSGESLLIAIERATDAHTYEWLKEISLGTDSILRVLYYFEQRLQNARMLKTVMLGKFYGLNVESIQEKLKHVGH